DVRGSQRIPKGRHCTGDALVEFCIDAKNRRFDEWDFVQIGGGSIEGRCGFQPWYFRRGLPGDATAKTVAIHRDPLSINKFQGPEVVETRGKVGDMAFSSGPSQRSGHGVGVQARRASFPTQKIRSQGNVSGLGETARYVLDMRG